MCLICAINVSYLLAPYIYTNYTDFFVLLLNYNVQYKQRMAFQETSTLIVRQITHVQFVDYLPHLDYD